MGETFFDSSVFSITSDQWHALIPYLWIAGGMALSTIFAAFKIKTAVSKTLSFLIFAPASFFFIRSLGLGTSTVFGTSLEIDAVTRIVGAGVTLFALISFLFSSAKNHEEHPELLPLYCVSSLGLCLLPGARDFVAFFVYLEALAISGYILVGLDTYRARSLEASLKYLLMGAFASAIFLMGAALIYGVSASFDFSQVAENVAKISGSEKTILIAGALLITASLLFKVALVPFHMWAPDVYQAAPTSIAAYLSTASKLSIFASICVLLSRTQLISFGVVKTFIASLSVASIFFGALFAVAQKSLKRLYAYSGVVNAGYLGLALAGSMSNTASIVTYLLIYGGTVISLFALAEHFALKLGKEPHIDVDIQELSRLSKKDLGLSTALFTMGVFSLAGIPPLPGFFAKYLLLKDLWIKGNQSYVYIILFGTLLGLAYYLRLLVPIYMNDDHTGENIQNSRRISQLILFVAAIAFIFSIGVLGGLNRLPQWVQGIDSFSTQGTLR